MKIKKTEATKFPFGVRFGRTRKSEILIIDFINQVDNENSEIFSSVAIDCDLAERIKREIDEFLSGNGSDEENEGVKESEGS